VPGQKVLVAVNTPYHADNGRLTGAQLMVDYPGQPDPGVMRTDTSKPPKRSSPVSLTARTITNAS